MAQIEKYTLRQAKHIIAHVERQGATHSNKQIDMAQTQNNYALWPPECPDRLILDTGVQGQSSGRYGYQRLKKRLAEVSCLQRNDVNVLCDWCVHLGVDVPPGYDSKMAFFRAAVKLMAMLYGPENVVYAWVHEDETHSHLHFGFIPVVKKPLKLRKNASASTRAEYEQAVAEGKTVIERVDSHAIINKKHLQGWHGWLKKYMTLELGYDPGVYTGITQAMGGNLSVKQLKAKAKDWREDRNKRADAFHAARRASREGERPNLDDRITLASQKPQEAPKVAKKLSLDDMIASAKNRMGRK